MSFLQNHPFAVEAFFESSVVLTFAVPKQELKPLIPDLLELDCFEDKWAFIAVAMVQTSELRPKGFPKFMGNSFFLTGYRIFVRYRNKAGKNLRGLYIIKSETNKVKMELLGNIFTNYKYTTTDILYDLKDDVKTIYSKKSEFRVVINISKEDVIIPINSPFKNWKDARKFAGPLPHTFTFNKRTNSMLVIQGVRQNWKPKPIIIADYHFEFLNNFQFTKVILASAFEITNIPYYWKRGKIESWD
ncbi:DUF2071 domain-containing protein [Maribacter sp. MAR_2009_72]|uniref:DUF2071 domain-containing protein n=1 Tax=Maribacter sp. MAR_2009_72 TaxID=1250050 RepID=UPI00119AC248|nr:DUF2071 domain-containing protein [Maribacter sp. MAR_2009_72]TVZ15337.1 uncharacterized protein DUF2071 [Maribacter sp. MAR_2009_72]